LKQIRYLLDENVPHAIRDGLLRRRPEVEILAVGSEIAPPLSTPDPEILSWIEREGYILITENRSTMPQHLRDHLEAGRHIPGIFILPRKYTIGGVIEDLLLIWEAAYPDEYQDKITYLPL